MGVWAVFWQQLVFCTVRLTTKQAYNAFGLYWQYFWNEKATFSGIVNVSSNWHAFNENTKLRWPNCFFWHFGPTIGRGIFSEKCLGFELASNTFNMTISTKFQLQILGFWYFPTCLSNTQCKCKAGSAKCEFRGGEVVYLRPEWFSGQIQLLMSLQKHFLNCHFLSKFETSDQEKCVWWVHFVNVRGNNVKILPYVQLEILPFCYNLWPHSTVISEISSAGAHSNEDDTFFKICQSSLKK